MAQIQIVLEAKDDGTGVIAPPSLSDLYQTWRWTPIPGTVKLTEVSDLGDGRRVYEVTGPDSLIAAIEASA